MKYVSEKYQDASGSCEDVNEVGVYTRCGCKNDGGLWSTKSAL